MLISYIKTNITVQNDQLQRFIYTNLLLKLLEQLCINNKTDGTVAIVKNIVKLDQIEPFIYRAYPRC